MSVIDVERLPAVAGQRVAAQAAEAEGGVARIDIARQALASAETAVGVRPDPADITGQRCVPVPGALQQVLPHGLRRGSITEVHGSTTVLLTLAQAAAGADRWCALVGMPDLGWAAAAGALNLERVVAVPDTAPDTAAVLGALVDGFDVLVIGQCPGLSPADRRTVASRVRQRGAVLLTNHQWTGSHLGLTVRTAGWDGIGQGHGLLRGQRMIVTALGRGALAGPVRQVQVMAGRDGLGVLEKAPVTPAPPPPERIGFGRDHQLLAEVS